MATISNSNYNSLVTGTATADSIANTGGHVTIQALGGNDTVTNNNEGHDRYSIAIDRKVYVAIDGGAGDDSIQISLSTCASIFGGDGNDSIESRKSTASTLRGGDGNDYIYNDDYNLSSIDGGAGDDEIHDSGYSTTINGGAGNDRVYSIDRYCSINGGDGDDSIDVDSYNKDGSGSRATVLGGEGNDFILTSGESLSIDGGADDDELHNSGHSTTINGGTGADHVHSTGKYCSINGGDNDDYIAVDGYSEDESDGDGSNTTILGGNGKDYIDNQGKNNYIDAGADNDYVWNRAGNVTINGGSGDDEIYDEFDFEGNANDVCIYAGAGNDTVYIQNPFGMIVGGAGNDHINLLGTSIFVPYASGDGNDTIYGFNESDLLTISGGSYSTQESGNDVIVKVGSGSILLAGAKGKSLHINVTQVSASTITLTEDSDDLYTTLQGTEIKALGGRDNIINSGSNVTIDGGTGDDLLQNENGANVLFTYANGDGNDEIYGFNETSTLGISGNAYSTQQSGDNVIVTVGDNSITLYNAASLSALHIDGEEKTDDTLTLTNDDAAKITLPAQIVTADATARTAAIRITGNKLDNSILGGTGKDTLYGGAGADSLLGGAGNDKLYGQTGNDYLEGGAGSDLLSGYTGDDTLYGGTANDTLTGGDGNDLFIYTSGKDVITDYEDGDKIALDAAISKSSVNGSDATFTIGSSTLTVKNGKGKEIVFVDATGNERTIIGGAYLSTDATASKATLAAWREVGDATERTKAVRLVGNELDNSILGGSGKDTLYGKDGNDYLAGNAGNDKLYGQNGNDTLWGGLGNDTLSGSTGADVFLYKTGEGKDVISGFANNDMLLITGAFTANVDASAKSIAFKVDSTADAITIKNYTATSFNINGFKYKISGSKLV